MYLGRVYHQGVSERRNVLPQRLDIGESPSQIGCTVMTDVAPCHRFRLVSRQGRSVRPRRLQYRKRHWPAVQPI